MTVPAISNHALKRFMERADQTAMQILRCALEEKLALSGAAAAQIDATEYLIVSDGLTFVVRNQVVVTVLERRSSSHDARVLCRSRD
tara:strand:- start:303 stop:563 length:261 start_codon:yes stop_codon:yes gene_type:complete